MANAVFVWGMARARGAAVLLRIEDHDRQRSRVAFDAALLEDLAWLGFEADEGPVRQSARRERYADALEILRSSDRVYACDCTRSTLAAAGWSLPGCPGGCRTRALADQRGRVLRVALGGGDEAWMDELVGPMRAPVAPSGDLPIRDRHGNWTYAYCVAVDDLHDGIDLVIRGRDLLEATPPQIRLARLLGREAPASFLHHQLIRKESGEKLSKSDGDTGVRELRAAGIAADAVIGRAAAAVGLLPDERPLSPAEAGALAAAVR